VDPVIDDAGQLGVLDECDLVDVLGLVAAHQEVPVQVIQIGLQSLSDERLVNAWIIFLNLNEVLSNS
jgi:hypothetical protein